MRKTCLFLLFYSIGLNTVWLNNIIRIRAERSFRTGMLRREIKYTTSINIGVLADNVGSGKTLSVLTLIALVPISIPFFDTKSVNINYY